MTINDIGSCFDQSISLQTEGKYQESINLLNIVINANYLMDKALCNKAVAYAKLGKFGLAMKYLKNSLNYNPDLSEAHYNIGMLFLVQQQFSKAKENFIKAKKLNPSLEIDCIDKSNVTYMSR